MTPNTNLTPPRKGVMAWRIEQMEENGDEFFVLTFHHGLGKMTRLDLGLDDLQGLIRSLSVAHAEAIADGWAIDTNNPS